MAVDARPVVDAKKTFFSFAIDALAKKLECLLYLASVFNIFFAAASTAEKKKSFLTLTPVQVSLTPVQVSML